MIKKVAIVLLLAVLAYSFFIEPNRLKVTNYRIENKSLKGVRIVFLSDLHVRPGDYSKLRNVVKLVNQQQPDAVLFGGGYLNGSKESSTMAIDKIAERLSLIDLRRNLYSVLGDSDLMSGRDIVVNELKKRSIFVIENTNRRLTVKGRVLYVAGIEDATSGRPDMAKALKGTKTPVILLSHSPDIFPHVPKFVALTLAGHTHGGQIHIPPLKPLILKSNFADKYIYGLVEEDGKKMIITSGVGTSKIHARLNCPPEIVVVDFM